MTDLARSGLQRLDAALNRLYGSRLNPLYQSGALTVALLAVLLVTGLYLLLFYRIGAPYASVAQITEQVWLGRWIRGLHRFASDAAVLAVAFHAFRMFAQGRSWGPRALAWVSGLFSLLVVFVCGWTGYVMVWDVQAQLLAIEGARLLDVLPIFSEPISRAFVGEAPIPSAFFFLNLFLHIALPIGLGLLVWIHVSRVARPTLLPPRPLLWGMLALLLVLSILWPIGMAAPADLLRAVEEAPVDFWYAFWLPVTRSVPTGIAWLLGGTVGLALMLVPVWTRPRAEKRPLPSVVNERLCTGCEQCYQDCPYDAIRMVTREDGRAGIVARVDPALCVSCGICAGSCAPMGVGPPGRTGRDQLAAIREFLATRRPDSRAVVLVGCSRSATAGTGIFGGAHVFAVSCAGNLHTSVVELLVRAGWGGVLIVSCPARDCWNREGAKWLEQRLFHEREAELQERVDRRRVRLVRLAAGESAHLHTELAQFRTAVERLQEADGEADVDVIALCKTVAEGGVS